MNNAVAITGRGFLIDIKKEDKKTDVILSNNFISYLKHLVSKSNFQISSEIKKQYLGISEYAGIGLQAGRFAWDESKYNDEIESLKWGIMVGTTFGDAPTLFKNQCDVFIKQGPQWIMPNLMINKGPKTIADILAIENKITGSNITFTSGRNASGMTILTGFDEIQHENLEGCLIVGAEYVESNVQNIAKMSIHANSSCLSSGAGSIVLKREPVKNKIFGKILYVHAEKIKNYKIEGNCICQSDIEHILLKTVKNAMITKNDIHLVMLNQLNHAQTDSIIRESIKGALDTDKREIPIITTTEILGDFIGANSIIMLILSTLIFETNMNLRYNSRIIRNILLITYDMCGNIWTAIVNK